MKTKTEKAKSLMQEGNLTGALRILKTFRLGFTPEEKRVIEIACESLEGNEGFYQRLGIDTTAMIEQSKEIINLKLYNE